MNKSAEPNRAARAYLGYVKVVETLGILTMAALVSIIVAQVGCRYILGFSLYWADEVTKSLMIWTAFLMAGLAYTQGELPAMRLLLELFPAGLVRIIDIIMAVLIVLTLIALARYGFEFAWRTRHQSMIALNISLFWVHVSIPVGCVLLIFHVALHKWLAPIQPYLETPVELVQ
ncbi:TRAP transporter small permease [Mesorhizobium sp. CGMCC 1.15528]|uniref:TRAP transporter small permease protein n=1 Tax=Mesorhizobium zhangyense TaxID=1776730 RepID=A0A7C9V7N9_9HYPH|nr:TRAP transporter small permease [Mesorhizobium zhangyense]NGN41863.1 TRAP transporter small permease [Mesorhizobium zhangyense]